MSDAWVSEYRQGKSIPQIADAYGAPRSRVRTALLREGVLRSRAEGVRLAMPRRKRSPKGKVSEQGRANMSAARLRWGEEHAKGVSQKSSGYRQITRGEHKHRGEHVVIMEQRLGRRLLPDESVHHIDGDPSNNNENNLALMTRSGHARLHRREDRLKKGQH